MVSVHKFLSRATSILGHLPSTRSVQRPASLGRRRTSSSRPRRRSSLRVRSCLCLRSLGWRRVAHVAHVRDSHGRLRDTQVLDHRSGGAALDLLLDDGEGEGDMRRERPRPRRPAAGRTSSMARTSAMLISIHLSREQTHAAIVLPARGEPQHTRCRGRGRGRHPRGCAPKSFSCEPVIAPSMVPWSGK